MNLVVSPEAKADLLEIVEYIARDSTSAAIRIFDQLEDSFRKLLQNPELGSVRPELVSDSKLRFWSIHTYLVVYRSRGANLEIVRVLSGYRDISSILG